MMTIRNFIKAWPLLTNQVKGLELPWLENAASRDNDPFKVLISCILSLRTQDKTTGQASERLFQLASDPESLTRLSVRTIEKAIYPVGFYRVKARRLRKMGKDILERHENKVPDTLEGLMRLEGVGRKTANLVLTLGYDEYGICVDTHVHRIVNRWGLVATKTPEKTEFALREVLHRKYWKKLNGMLVAFGQGICKPISPLCSRCRIRMYCDKNGVARHR
jgi:endonuclease-3